MAMSFADLILDTLNKLPMHGEFGTYLPYQRWVAVDKIWKQEKVGRVDGLDWTFFMTYRTGTNTTFGTYGQVRTATITDNLVKGTLTPINCWFDVTYTEHDVHAQMGPAKIINNIEQRRITELVGFYKQQEDYLWGMPSTTGNLLPHGIPYHLPPITTTQVSGGTSDGAFQGGNPVGFSSWAGIDLSATAYSTLNTWNACWNSASATTLTIDETNKKRLGRMMRQLDFVAPTGVPGLASVTDRFGIFAPQVVIEALEAAQVAANDLIGNDVLRYRGTGLNIGGANNGITINGLNVTYTPALDTADATNRGYLPLYMVNLDQFKVLVNPKKFMLKRPVVTPWNQPDTFVEYFDCEFTYGPTDRSHKRQLGGVISYVA